MRKKLLSIVLTLCMVITMLPTITFASESDIVSVGGVKLSQAKPY